MPDGSVAPAAQRAFGEARLRLAGTEAPGALADLYQAGSARVFLPRTDGPLPEAVFLNTAGGLTGGDRLAFGVALGPGARAVATTQTAERAYASAGGTARLDVTLELGAGAALDWLPQETILFDGAALGRRTVASLAAGARLILLETLVLGRAAMGEHVRRLALTDWREVRRGGRRVVLDPVRMGPPAAGPDPAGLDGARAVAVLWLVADGAEDAAGAARAALAGAEGVAAAASGWDGRAVVRILGPDAHPVCQAVRRVLAALTGRPLPRVWRV